MREPKVALTPPQNAGLEAVIPGRVGAAQARFPGGRGPSSRWLVWRVPGSRRGLWAGRDGSTTIRGPWTALRDGSSSSLMGAGSPAGPLRRSVWWVDLSLFRQ